MVNGLPNFYSDTDLDGCDVCFNFRMRRNSERHGYKIRNTLKVNQVISLDWGFIIHKYRDK